MNKDGIESFTTVISHQEPDYESIILTPEEEKEALLEGKRRKHFKQKSASYWDEKEKEVNLSTKLK